MKVSDDLKALKFAIGWGKTNTRFYSGWDIVDRSFKSVSWALILAAVIRATLFLAHHSAFASSVGAVLGVTLLGLMVWVSVSPFEGIFAGLSKHGFYSERRWQRRLLVYSLTGLILTIWFAVTWFWVLILPISISFKP
jgi:hypothetical protein